MSCSGNIDLSTPHMDRISSEGVRFENAYCTAPLCTPSRASMFTGLMPQQTCAWRNFVPMGEHVLEWQLGIVLGQNGYKCLYGGKWHIPNWEMPSDNPYGFHVFCGHDDNNLAEACIGELRKWSNSGVKDRKPFFMVASFDNPHNICEYSLNRPLPWGSVPKPSTIEECPNLPPNFPVPAFEPEAIRVEQESNWLVYPGQHYTEDDWRKYRWGYCRLVEKVDHEIGKVLHALSEYHLDDNTVVIFSSDHGDGQGAHKWNQKSVLYEETVKVPLVVRAPGGMKGIVESHVVSIGLDLFPTICDYAGLTAPSDLQGISLRRIIEGKRAQDWREALFIETFFEGRSATVVGIDPSEPGGSAVRGYGARGRAVRTTKYKYIVYDRGRLPEQLFNLANDPGEMVDLSVEKKHRELLDYHRCLLEKHIEVTGDDFNTPKDIYV